MSSTASKGHLMGGKYTGSHTSVTETALSAAKAAHKLEGVQKIALGIIKHIPHGPLAVKFLPQGNDCVLIKVRGNCAIQEIWVWTNQPQQLEQAVRLALKLP